MLSRLIATVFFMGYFPIAPGTATSAVAVVILGILKPEEITIFLMFLISSILGTFASHRLEKKAERKDPSYIVIDEFAGYLLTVLFIPITWKNLLLGFILFRCFDILKPPPIGQIGRCLKGGLAIMIDDIMAGAMANLLLRLLLML